MYLFFGGAFKHELSRRGGGFISSEVRIANGPEIGLAQKVSLRAVVGGNYTNPKP